MTTTPSTASQAPAVSIHSSEYEILLDKVLQTGEANAAIEGALKAHDDAIRSLTEHIDAKLAQARQGALAEADIIHKDLLATMSESGKIWQHRATAAEAKLAELQMEVETMLNDAVFFMGTIELHALDGVALGERLKELLYQSQADESGLTG